MVLRHKVLSRALGLSAGLATTVLACPAWAAPDLWPDYKHVGTERVSDFKPAQDKVEAIDSKEVAGSRKTVRRNERVDPLRESSPVENHHEFKAVDHAPVYSTKIQGRIQMTMATTRVDKTRYDWTETPYKDYTVQKWEQRDEFLKDVTYRRTLRSDWQDPKSGKAMSYTTSSTYGTTESDATPWAAKAAPKVFVAQGILKTEKVGPTFVSFHLDVKEVGRRPLASFQANVRDGLSVAAAAGGAGRAFQGDSAKGVTRVQEASGATVAAQMGARKVKAAPKPVSIKAPKLAVIEAVNLSASAPLGTWRPENLTPPKLTSKGLLYWASEVQDPSAEADVWRNLVELAASVNDAEVVARLGTALYSADKAPEELKAAKRAVAAIKSGPEQDKAQQVVELISEKLSVLGVQRPVIQQ
ncbi:MAG: hypothetical protein VKO21_03810 [Candidatus Sericytochromatia bacterium]|nr:hypothetical protein [Candidatus Sericytochromatia bacterium]